MLIRPLAFTLHDPWAMLTYLEEKKIETRGQPFRYRGYVVIHAAKVIPAYAREYFNHPLFITALQGRRAADMCSGCGLCVVQWLGCIRTNTVDKINTVPGLEDFIPGRFEMTFGDYSEGENGQGRYAIPMKMIKKFERPVPARGSQGLWRWPYEIDLPPMGGQNALLGS